MFYDTKTFLFLLLFSFKIIIKDESKIKYIIFFIYFIILIIYFKTANTLFRNEKNNTIRFCSRGSVHASHE